MRRFTYLLLGVMLLQLSGWREVCFAQPRASHGCCPAPKSKPAPNPSSLPECCQAMVLTVQGSVAEVTNGSSHSVSVQPVKTTHVTDPILPRVTRQPEILTSSGLILPPLTPLHQTCLLLM